MMRVLPYLMMMVVVAFIPRNVIGDEPKRLADVVSPTVQLRNGNKTGSGTIIQSAPDNTLILTAAHVVRDAGDLKVEIHRHNLNPSSRTAILTEGGGWPRLIPATVEVFDTATDVALVRIRGMARLPSSAHFDPKAMEPVKGEVLTSVGIDRSLHLTRWRTNVEGAAMLDIRQGGVGERRFIVTTKYPEHGRSGGGLFRSDGTVVGVCVGQLSLRPGSPKVGIFASVESVRNLFEEYESKKPRKVHPTAVGQPTMRRTTGLTATFD